MPRGGQREGAGRKPGVPSERTIQRLATAKQAIEDGKTPLEVMLGNMRHFDKVATDAEAILEGLTAEEFMGREMEPAEQFKALLAEVKKAAGFRQMAQECASDAAPYLHHRLASMEHTGKDGGALTVKIVD